MGRDIDKYINRNRVEALLGDLVEIYSPYLREEKVMDFVYGWFKERDIPVEYHRYYEDKITNHQGVNVIGRIKGKNQGIVVLLNGHLDTVEICEGWTKEPLKATIEGNKLFGLGAVDMKAGVVAIMLALEAFKNTNLDFNGEILYTFVSDEEGPFGLGTDSLILDGITDNVDVALVPESSNGFCKVKYPCLCLGALGGWSYTVNFFGRSAHAATPEDGINAVTDAAKVALELEKTELRLDDKLGKGSICITKLEGGGALCSVPQKASFTVYRHVVRGENRDTIKKEVIDAVKKANIKSEVSVSFRNAPHKDCVGYDPYIVLEDSIYTEAIKSSISSITEKACIESYIPGVGDFNYLGGRSNIPTYIFGPDGGNFHTADEYVMIDSVVETSKVIFDFLCRLLT
ncbi:M20/M25/M40 family metallo-hydrolase [Wukongibacter baidiensis]|uniref:M20 family metallopeptidase n=1 Tax=Wukongibacter baidiensis TaxID=1723361 RepID=UPI003D7FA063